MVILPFIVGAGLGGISWIHLPLFLGWFSLYLASHPLLMMVKRRRERRYYAKWTAGYMAMAALFLAGPLMNHPELIGLGLLLIPGLVINIYFAMKKNERAIVNDLTAIAGLCLGGPIAYLAGTGSLDRMAGVIWLLCVLFFTGSVFYVKQLIRERNNPQFRRYARVYHILVLAVILVSEFWIVAMAYLPSLIRVLVFSRHTMSPRHIGMVEIGNSIAFGLMILILL